jgi:hypothetical protein
MITEHTIDGTTIKLDYNEHTITVDCGGITIEMTKLDHGIELLPLKHLYRQLGFFIDSLEKGE